LLSKFTNSMCINNLAKRTSQIVRESKGNISQCKKRLIDKKKYARQMEGEPL